MMQHEGTPAPVAAAAPLISLPQLWQAAATAATGIARCQRAMAAARLRSLMLVPAWALPGADLGAVCTFGSCSGSCDLKHASYPMSTLHSQLVSWRGGMGLWQAGRYNQSGLRRWSSVAVARLPSHPAWLGGRQEHELPRIVRGGR
jgi:hypothetical protein